ncbi:Lysosomal-Associated Transmembrane Domain containing [Caenorhabditis elegans]|uniref:Lysosomal-Associated Transmembrane Domain containing n=1 Tax=Caenorhabditis elegans TaxID=6239 RepID=Q18527_CAEEL|nr:Lysosomal-Associated Transmembrane Domain containing [Caenorhabditis elegans]CCD63856.1 Lysosomal-Associated Transmembrane Domain containing [Caenorhabditis elegans]|eukprot:NP_509332.2 Uncharacterized protein CELE_C39D10.6 [Caenorhabditis elegans]
MRGVSDEYFDDFYPDFHMAATANRVPFDQNDKKYKCLCGQLHIKKGARIVAILVNILTAVNIIFSFTRSSTVFVYTCMSTAFSIVIFGSLLFGVWKEKRLYLYPYLFFQVISIAISIIVLFIFLISIAVGASMVIDLARNVGNVDTASVQEKLDADLALFTVLFILFLCLGGLIQAYFAEVIYSFHNFLKDRENSFSFHFESYSNSAFGSEATPTPPPTYPEAQVSVA